VGIAPSGLTRQPPLAVQFPQQSRSLFSIN